jgi:ADP-ribose pyrophosphatase
LHSIQNPVLELPSGKVLFALVRRKRKMKKVIHEGKYLKFIDEDGWEYVKRRNCTGIVIIVAKTRDDKVILVEQPRKPVGRNVIEWAAGLVNDRAGKPHESFAAAGKREMFEETGYLPKKMKRLVAGPASPGLSGETVEFYLATGLVKKGRGGGDKTESITVHEVPLSTIHSWLAGMEKKGKAVDPKVYIGLYFLTSSKKN